jgi:hypothetical protein
VATIECEAGAGAERDRAAKSSAGHH